MPIWIRSQDKKELVNVEDICLVAHADKTVEIISRDQDCSLGIYGSKDKAMQVLDIIQGFISEERNNENFNITMHNYENWNALTVTFEMPSDEQVSGGEKNDTART